MVTLVIYWSANEWRAPTTLQELTDFPEPELREFTPDYRMKPIQPFQMEVKDFEKFSSSLGKMLHYAKCLNSSSVTYTKPLALILHSPRFLLR